MKLLVDELGKSSASLVQQITIGDKNLDVTAIRPYLYFHNQASGSIALEIEDANGKKIATSESLSIATIKAGISSLGFDHGLLRFYVNASLRKNTTYGIRLVSSGGYSFADAAYVGWCRDYDLRIVGAAWSPSTGANSALLMELWGNDSMLRRVG